MFDKTTRMNATLVLPACWVAKFVLGWSLRVVETVGVNFVALPDAEHAPPRSDFWASANHAFEDGPKNARWMGGKLDRRAVPGGYPPASRAWRLSTPVARKNVAARRL